MTTEEIKLIKDFNRNVSWLKTKEMKKVPVVTAQQLTKMTGWDKEMLRRKRNRKEIDYERVKTGGFRYKLNDLVQLLPS